MLQLCGGCLRRDLRDSGSNNLKTPAQLSLTHGLLAHSALVCVPGGLVMVGVGDEASAHP